MITAGTIVAVWNIVMNFAIAGLSGAFVIGRMKANKKRRDDK